jgi:hypothetical protein
MQALNQIDAVLTLAMDQGGWFGSAEVENVGDLLRSGELGTAAEVYDGLSKAQVQKLRYAFATSFLAESEFNVMGDSSWVASSWVADETRRRALLLQLALIAYRLDYGSYPQTLAELSPGWLAEPITDPFSGQPFVYRPEGLPHKLLRYQDDKVAFIEAGTPLIWSVGYDNMQLMEARPMEFIVRQYGGSPAVDEKLLAAAQAGEEYYLFQGTQRGGSIRFVFPLPKVETKQADD